MASNISMTKDGKFLLGDIVFATYAAAAMGKQLTEEQLRTLEQPITSVSLHVSFGEILID